MAGLTAAVAEFIVRTSASDFPEGVIDRAKKVIADTFGAIVASAHSEVAPPLLRYIRSSGESGSSPILGTGMTSSPELAALANGTFGAALEFDDVLAIMPGHPSAVIVPALIADIGSGPCTGRDFIESYVVGLEVGAKIAVGITIGHYHRGFHVTGTIGIFSALAALAKRYRLDAATIRTALGIAASMSSGVQRNFGTMTKPFHSGWAARSALAAVSLARCGFTSAGDALEAEHGFFAAFGTDKSDSQLTSKALGHPWAIMDPGNTLKKFPCCYAAHRGIDALLQIRQSLGLTPENLKAIDCHVPPGGLLALIYSDPKNGLESKFSMEYALAAGVLDGEYTLRTFTDEAVRRPGIRELLKKIRVFEDPHCVRDDPLYETRSSSTRGYIELDVQTVDGRTARKSVKIAPGHPSRALSWDEMRDKFDICTREAGIEPARAEQAFSVLRHFESHTDVRELLPLLSAPRS